MKTLTSTTSPESGFTLIELLVVLAIVGMLVALVPIAFNKLQEGSQYRDTVRGIVTQLRQARQQAQSEGRNVAFQIDLRQRKFGIQGQPQRLLPASLEVKTTVADLTSGPTDGLALIVFMPEGGATGGSIELVRASGASVRIRVDWLLGQITQEPRVL